MKRLCGQAHPWLCEDCRARAECSGEALGFELAVSSALPTGEMLASARIDGQPRLVGRIVNIGTEAKP